MKSKLLMAALGVLAFGFISTPYASAGTEVIQDNGGREVSRPYGYAPPPPPRVYYAPPPVGFAVYPRFGYYRRPFRAYGFHRRYWRRGHWR
jgi:hypothetical protein